MALPVAGIVCIVLACWVVVVLALFALYQFLKHRGSCDCECAPCGTEGGESCSCCKAVSDACNCCNPSLNGCLNSVCPKKKVSCVDIILCQCCAEPGQDSCLVNTLQYTFYCPCKCFAEHCMVGYGEAAVTIWEKEGMSFCQWMASKLGCSKCESVNCCTCDIFKCSEPDSEDSECFPVLCRPCKSTQPVNSKCLDCDCNKSLQALCSKFNSWTCTCANDNSSCLNVFKRCNCFMISNSKSVTCPTFEVQVSNNVRNVLQCPGCPDHVLCFSCSEDQGINCCCHYVFFNRCGDPNFSYNGRKDICTWRENNICTFMFQALQSLCRCLCLGTFGLCENSIRCCFYSSLFCKDLVCCKCSDKDFCRQCSFLCFDCHKLQNIAETSPGVSNGYIETSPKDVSNGCSCACFTFKSYESSAVLEFINTEIQVQGPSPSLPGDIHSISKEHVLKKSLSTSVRKNENVSGISNEKKEVSTRSNTSSERKVRKKKTKTDPVVKRKRKNKTPVGQGKSKCEKLDDEEADVADESESCLDFEHMQRLQDDLLRRHSDEIETDVEEISIRSTASESKTSDKYFDEEEYGYGQDKGKWDVTRKKGSRTGILKAHSNYSPDYKGTSPETTTAFSVYNEIGNRERGRSKKRAHFANEDEELVKELFPQNFARSRTGETTFEGRRKQRKRRRRTNNDALRKHDTSSDESEINDSIRTSATKSKTGKSKLKSNVRPQYDGFDEDDRKFEMSSKTLNKPRSLPGSFNSSIGQSQKVSSNKYKEKVTGEKSEQGDAVELIDYMSSEEENFESVVERNSSKGLTQNYERSKVKFAVDEMKLENLDELEDDEYMV